MKFPIITAKLNPPSLPDVWVPRSRLDRLLDLGQDRSLTLVAAPAGYGKSSAVAHWISQRSDTCIWISLNHADSGLKRFLAYLLTGIRNQLSGACPETWGLVNGNHFPDIETLAGVLSNEVATLNRPLNIVLDDYHLIGDAAIHRFLEILLDHLPPSLHLTIVTRRDPPLPLAALRADGRMTEIRQRELRFTEEEVASFFRKSQNRSLSSEELESIQQHIEGWVVGLRLISLALAGIKENEPLPPSFFGDNVHVREYLIGEILDKQPPEMSAMLLRTAILDRFCAPLCEALKPAGTAVGGAPLGERFISYLEHSGQLSVSLDGEQTWYRYHHLFRQVLVHQMGKRLATKQVARLHRIAAKWFEGEGLIEEAVHHAGLTGDPMLPATMITEHRLELMNQERWELIGSSLQALPRPQVEADANLSLLAAWYHWNRAQNQELIADMARAEKILLTAPPNEAEAAVMQGELNALKSFLWYMGPPADGPQALRHAEEAMAVIPHEHHSTRGFALIMQACSRHMTGEVQAAYDAIHEAMARPEAFRNTYHARLLTTLGFLRWIDGDLELLHQTGLEHLELAESLDLPESRGIANHFLGLTHYFRGNLLEAIPYLEKVVLRKDVSNICNFSNSTYLLALAYQAENREREARDIVATALRYAMETNNAGLLASTQAFQAELATRQDALPMAKKWADTFVPEPFRADHQFYVPQLTLARVLLIERTPESLGRLGDLLTQMNAFYTAVNHTRMLLEVQVLQAMRHQAEGCPEQAISALEEAVVLAAPGGFIYPFADYGAPMGEMLGALIREGTEMGYIKRIRRYLAGQSLERNISEAPPPPSAIHLSDTPGLFLSVREQEVLTLLAARFTNKEIGERLFISPVTVKRHTANIYRKLRVKSRQEAAEKGRILGILDSE